MSKGTILDCRIKIKPSEKLRSFIIGLHTYSELPENVGKIYQAYNSGSKKEKKIEYIPQSALTEKEKEILKKLSSETDHNTLPELYDIEESEDEDIVEGAKTADNTDKENQSKTKIRKIKADEKNKYKASLHLDLNDVKWLNEILKEKRERKEDDTDMYLYELLEGSKLILPKNEIIPRNPELEARCQKLKQEQEAREYRNMTKNVDASRKYTPEDTISFQLKAINRQLIAVLQFIFSVIAGFAFGFIGVELIIGNLDFGFRLLLGIICALVIALAEIYFLAKKLNEYDEIPIPTVHPGSSKLHKD